MTTSNTSTAAIHNIIHRRGDSFPRIFRFYSDSQRTTPLNISSHQFKCEVRRPGSSNNPVLTFQNGNGFTIGGQNNNELTMYKTSEEMSIDAGVYEYDIQQEVDGKVKTIITGSFKIIDDITA